jgi:hypothetical protein
MAAGWVAAVSAGKFDLVAIKHILAGICDY